MQIIKKGPANVIEADLWQSVRSWLASPLANSSWRQPRSMNSYQATFMNIDSDGPQYIPRSLLKKRFVIEGSNNATRRNALGAI